ncbi:hypothetical protein [Aestuariivita boseongensis]|nr:hypothetical protein [Aestuariivita boseongensis]
MSGPVPIRLLASRDCDFRVSLLAGYGIKPAPPLTPYQSGSLHFTAKETA